MQRAHIHSNLLEQILSMIYATPEPICFYKVKAHSGIAGYGCADANVKHSALHDEGVHPSTRLALHMWVLSWGCSQTWWWIFWVPRTNALWALMLLFSQLGRNIRWQLLARYTSQIVGSVARTWAFLCHHSRKDSAGNGDTASMIKGGGYLGARTRRKQ